jgi:glycosyltransferase involved in cell wall biosynthesis
MIKKSKVAIGLIAYNHSNFIIDAIKSIQEQNYKNFDLFVSVDKSIDNTYYIAKNFLKKNFSNYRLYNQKKNIGVTGNSNILLKKIKFSYKFFSLFSVDDIMRPDKLSLQINALQKRCNRKC